MFPDWETQEIFVLVRSYKSPVIIVSIAIAVLSLLEAPHVSAAQQFSDKLLHSLGYLVLAITALWALADWSAKRVWHYFVACTYVVVYGGVIELLQAWCTQTRTGDWLDWLADVLGAMVGLIIVYVVSLGISLHDV